MNDAIAYAGLEITWVLIENTKSFFFYVSFSSNLMWPQKSFEAHFQFSRRDVHCDKKHKTDTN